MELLFENYSEYKILTEGKDAEKKYYVEGITLQGNLKNGNARIYPTDVLKESTDEHVDKYLNKNRALGELGHPNVNPDKINYDNVSHKFIKVSQDGDNFITKAQVLDTPKGKILKNLIDGEVNFGISSRAFGTTKMSNGTKVVQKLQIVSLGDIEHEPSAPDAFMTAVMEKKDWVYENGILIGKDLSESIDGYRKTLNDTPANMRSQEIISIFADYFRKLKG